MKLYIKIASFSQNEKDKYKKSNKGYGRIVAHENKKCENSNIPFVESRLSSQRGEAVGGKISYAQAKK